ncbi:CLC_0170 family protein [Anaerocellum danielii]|uniref:CLC_0170 family protein n=1 Tax=Anaerocellum danielii TaxID=1387557 RepID=A0ABZ0TXC1_9FIRM|nr:CLC_0170 family protein [Caldicellulosiruptor danielii]WPX08096.1 CLC_0170 family protein [Caldicellulosiruptor danielii]
MIKLSDIITKYSILMFLLSGILIFLLDVRELKSKNLQREMELAKITGILLVCIGVFMYIIKLFI